MGKTSFVLSIAVNVAKQFKEIKDACKKKGVLYFTVGENIRTISHRLISMKTGVSAHLLQNKLYEEQVNTIVKEIQEIENLPLYINDSCIV